VTIKATSCSRRHGFTLMELLLAVAVFAIVLAALNTVYFAALRLRNQTMAGFDAALPIEQAIAIMKRDLAAVRPPGGGAFSGQFQSTSTTNTDTSLETTGVRVSPDLYTGSGFIDEWTPFSEVQKVAYFLAMPTNQSAGRDLVRAVSRNLKPASGTSSAGSDMDRQFMLEGVENVFFQYYDGAVWQETWDSTTSSNLPFAVRVQIAMLQTNLGSGLAAARRAPIEFVVPIKCDVLTNQVATATATGGGQP
jgi:type II secretion system protein J